MWWPANPIGRTIGDMAPWPIKTVRVASPDDTSPGYVMVDITWDAGTDFRDPQLDSNGRTASGWERVSSSYRLAHLDSREPEVIEAYVSELGWLLGAGYMYRWHNAPGRRHEHLWGLAKSMDVEAPGGAVIHVPGASGDQSEELAEACERLGVWQWEINSAYRKAEGMSADRWPKWAAEDPTRGQDGSRESAWMGWEGLHPYLRATEPGAGYESRYYYCKPRPYVRGRDVMRRGL